MTVTATEAARLLRIAQHDLHMAWLQHLDHKPPHSHDSARLLVLLEQAGVEV